jgi:hypothetical protein
MKAMPPTASFLRAAGKGFSLEERSTEEKYIILREEEERGGAVISVIRATEGYFAWGVIVEWSNGFMRMHGNYPLALVKEARKAYEKDKESACSPK